jgi:hypothetical protein
VIRARLAFVVCMLAALFGERLAFAQQAPLDRAKDLFRQGNELRKAGDCARALAFYLESRNLVPSVANTTNSAVCMAELGKDDEALEMYEELLVSFRADLTDDESRALTAAMADLRDKLGRLDVSSNVQGLLVVDGRPRGQLPLGTPVPVKPGPHVVRVIKEGYETFEQAVTAVARATVAVDAKLTAFAHAGRLRVETTEAEDAGADVSIDGALIGHAPWEGTLAPGAHVLVVRRETRGSGPLRAVVVEDQTVLVRSGLARLGPEFRLAVEPSSASLSIDGVVVGTGEWRDALPMGRHTFEARADAYLPGKTVVQVTESPLDTVTMRLAIDPSHARWNERRSGHGWLELSGAFAIASGLASSAEASCDRVGCSGQGAALGVVLAGRVGYELPSGLDLYLGVGYVALRTTLSRSIDASFGSTAAGGAVTRAPITYDLHDTVDFSGPFASAGVGYAIPVGKTFEVGARGELGAVLASGSDAVTGTIRGGGRTLDLAIENSGNPAHAAAPFVMPEVHLRARFGRFYGGAGVGLAILFLSGPTLETGAAAPKNFDCAAHVGAADCAPASTFLQGERAFGPAVVFLPTLDVGTTF